MLIVKLFGQQFGSHLLVRMISEGIHTEDNREIRDILDELNFIIFSETIIDEIEAQGRSYQVDREES